MRFKTRRLLQSRFVAATSLDQRTESLPQSASPKVRGGNLEENKGTGEEALSVVALWNAECRLSSTGPKVFPHKEGKNLPFGAAVAVAGLARHNP